MDPKQEYVGVVIGNLTHVIKLKFPPGSINLGWMWCFMEFTRKEEANLGYLIEDH